MNESLRSIGTDLLDMPVLCVIDTRSVQKYMFHANEMEETMGAEVIMQTMAIESIRFAAEHVNPPLSPEECVLSNPDADGEVAFSTDGRIKVQVLDAAASNMILAFRTGRLCRDVVRKMARYYLDNSYSLQFSSACAEWTGDMAADMDSLFRNLGESKRRAFGAHPVMPFSIVRVERNTGEPVALVDSETGEELSRVSMLRRRCFARSRGSQWKDRQVRMLRRPDGRGFYGVAHVDGNNMGALVVELSCNSPAGSDPLRNRHALNRSIPGIIRHAIAAATEDVKRRWGLDDAQAEQAVRVIQLGGDDMNVAASPDVVFFFVERYLAHLSDIPLWEDARRKVFMSGCAGIAIVGEGTDYVKAFDYAEECCERAKDVAKAAHNLVDGRAGNWLDYCIVYPDRPDDSEADRNEAYVASDGTGLMLRPYCVDPAFRDAPHGYGGFRRRVEALAEMRMDRETVARLMLTCGMGVGEVRLYANGLAVNGASVVDRLGEPIVRDRDRNCAAWYDALELYGFMCQTDWRISR